MKSNMKKVVAAAVGAVAMMGAVSSANAAGYAGVQLGMVDASGLDAGTSIIGTYGVPMPEVNEYFSIEGEISKVLGKPEHSETFFGNTYTTELDYWTIAGYAALAYPLNDKFSIRGKIGLLYESIKVTAKEDLFGTSVSASDSDIGLAFGFGATYAVSPTMNAIAEFSQIESDITTLSAGVQFKF